MIRQLLNKLRLRRALTPSTTAGIPMQSHEQHAELTDDQKWEKAHGFSVARAPMPWTDEQTAHNLAVDTHYDEQILERQAAYLNGTYQPRFIITDPNIFAEAMSARERGVMVPIHCINWHLEMSMRPEARVNVTHESEKQQASLTPEELAQAREAGRLGREVAGLEQRELKRLILRPEDDPGTPAQQAFDRALKGVRLDYDDMTVKNADGKVIGLID